MVAYSSLIRLTTGKPNETTSPRDNPVHGPARHEDVAVEYVTLKECRSIFSAANEIHLEFTGEKVGAYEGLDGAFIGIWDALAAYPAWTVLILDEVDHIAKDGNYEPSEFLYPTVTRRG